MDGRPISARIFIPFCPGTPHTFFLISCCTWIPEWERRAVLQECIGQRFVLYHVVFEISSSILLPEDECLSEGICIHYIELGV